MFILLSTYNPINRWDEIGYFDIPACIHYVLAVSGWDKLVYAGHSLGTGLFFIAMIRHPELNSKIHRMLALAPISSKHNLRSPFRLVSPMIARLAVNLLPPIIIANTYYSNNRRQPIFDIDTTGYNG